MHDDSPQPVRSRGLDLLGDPWLNKSTAFSAEERRGLGLVGLLPDHVSTLEEQLARTWQNVQEQPTPLLKHAWLRALQDRNETLFYALLDAHLKELMPIVYTPTVAEACRRYSHIFQRPRGIFVTPENVGELAAMVAALPDRAVELIVATDNQRILGIGDQGVGGMGIPIGKASLYVAGAGLHPARTLPVTLDVGTDNPELLADPLYLGLRRPRLRGPGYFAFLERFVQGVREHLPGAVLQWEDLGREAAYTALERYRHEVPSFNDDIQGTGAMALAGLLAAEPLTGRPLADSTLVILGAGEAGLGLARQARALLGAAWARERLFVLDSRGLLVAERTHDEEKRPFAVPLARLAGWGLRGEEPPTLLEVVRQARPQALVAATGKPGTIGEDVVRELCRHAPRPVVFPLSNPTSHAEATPAQILAWSEGRALVGTGSPFPALEVAGRRVVPAQANNVLIFPGVGLGTLVARAREVSDGMFTAAATRLAALVSPAELAQDGLFPDVGRLREVSAEVAIAVARAAREEGLAQAPPPVDLSSAVRSRMWRPRYRRYVPAS